MTVQTPNFVSLARPIDLSADNLRAMAKTTGLTQKTIMEWADAYAQIENEVAAGTLVAPKTDVNDEETPDVNPPFDPGSFIPDNGGDPSIARGGGRKKTPSPASHFQIGQRVLLTGANLRPLYFNGRQGEIVKVNRSTVDVRLKNTAGINSRYLRSGDVVRVPAKVLTIIGGPVVSLS